ncbi:hypothetical protein B7R22_14120 [Subtercola boreus]|uniref:HTH tetR-type domain-containing protein n=1 Tax=Subtercola boreus TaxID=120213 RepID=A0A3E0VSZ1_9MICO|nr:TetR/AcrR family transcriptional regulator [Subtercola boreus]RFA13132.1 hypothetical protein B7R22_14120 [Subtercola boreus]
MTKTAGRDHGARTFTVKGQATRTRIVKSASRLIAEQGMERATLEEIQGEAGVSASQLYHYFADKSALILAVVEDQTDVVLGSHRALLQNLDSFQALHEWRDMIVDSLEAQHCVGGCPLGSLTGTLAESNPLARQALKNSFTEWERLLRTGLNAMRERGQLRKDTDTEGLAVSLLAAVQGGLLLSQTRRDSSAVRIALDSSIAYLYTLRP